MIAFLHFLPVPSVTPFKMQILQFSSLPEGVCAAHQHKRSVFSGEITQNTTNVLAVVFNQKSHLCQKEFMDIKLSNFTGIKKPDVSE